MQNNSGTNTLGSISGIQRNVQNKGQCIEIKSSADTLQVPIDFINKIGIFEFHKDGGVAVLEIVHLSYMEFCAATSLCRAGLDIKKELSQIKDQSRYEAVAVYLAGLLASGDEIPFNLQEPVPELLALYGK